MPPQNPQQPVQTPGPQPSYDFILSPNQTPHRPLFSGFGSPLKMVIIGGFVIIILVVIFVMLLSNLSRPKLDSMVAVAKDQQELIHLATNANQQSNLSPDNKNMVATVQLSVSSAQSQLLTYLANNHYKTNVKTLNTGINTGLDQQLSNAAAAGTYNQGLQDAMKQQINSYISDMQQSLTVISGPKGKALLNYELSQAQLLLNQVDSASPVGS